MTDELEPLPIDEYFDIYTLYRVSDEGEGVYTVYLKLSGEPLRRLCNAGEWVETIKRKMSEIDGADEDCPICKGEGWVCEDHPDVAWNYGNPPCCGGAGMPCKCNPLHLAGEEVER